MSTCLAGHENPDSNAFCGQCGQSLQATPTLPSADATAAIPETSPIDDVVKVVMTGFSIQRNVGYVGTDNFLETIFDVTNLTEKPLVALQFTVEVLDVFGVVVFSGHWNLDQRIGAGQTLKTERGRGWQLNEYLPDHNRLMSMDRSQLRIQVLPVKVAFGDGSVVSR